MRRSSHACAKWLHASPVPLSASSTAGVTLRPQVDAAGDALTLGVAVAVLGRRDAETVSVLVENQPEGFVQVEPKNRESTPIER
jgi:hypothetical protein